MNKIIIEKLSRNPKTTLHPEKIIF